MELSELDRLIDLRVKQVRQNGSPERPAEPAWAESVKRYNSAKDAARREAWAAFHRLQAERHRRTLEDLARYHDQRAEELSSEQTEPTEGRD
jgi:acyl-CoA reductase-like NAD-dependent aldehyde dehydrogenase